MKINLPVTGRQVDVAADANILSTTDLSSAITYANDDFIKICGYSREQLLGAKHNLLRHPDMPQAAFAHMWQTLKSGRSWMGMVKNRCQNGDHYWVSAFATPMTQNGQAVEYQSVRTRPTEQQIDAAEKAYTQLRSERTPLMQRLPVLGPGLKLTLLFSAILACVVGLEVWLNPSSLIYGLLALVGGSALVAAGTWRMLRPLMALSERARQIVDNPLSQGIYTGRRDEFGQIEFALQMLEAQIGAVVGRIGDASQRLAGHAAELVEHLQGSHSSTLDQQAETDHVAAAINQMSTSVAQVASHAQQAAVAADMAGSETLEGHQLVSESRQAVVRLADELTHATAVIHQLEGHSSEITGVLEVIRSIAEQTNLLALNAAIEAARAGDAGRGFAVVADEVRGLAQRTQQSTNEIERMINTLQNGTRDAVLAMQQSGEQVQCSVDQARRAAEALDGISRRVNQISEMNLQIASAVEEQSTVSENINRNISSIRGACEVMVSEGQRSQANSADVAGLAGDLRRLAQEFWRVRR